MTFFKQLTQHIQDHQTIIIHRHVNADPDALGSQLGLAQLIRDNFGKTVYCVGKNVESLAFIGTMDTIPDVNYQDSLVIVVDTANTPRIDDGRYTTGNYLIKIDHHPDVDVYGDLQYVDTIASSTSEIVMAYALSEQLSISVDTARYLYTGIVGDTGRFLFPNTTSKTLCYAAKLRELPFEVAPIHEAMTTVSLAEAKLQGYILQNITILPSGVAYVILTQEILTQFNVTTEQASRVVSVPSTIKGIICWGVFVEQSNGYYRCRLRSKGPAINQIAEQHDGGGHPLASGANASSLSEIDSIIAKLNRLVEE